jgi:hypothetical protein
MFWRSRFLALAMLGIEDFGQGFQRNFMSFYRIFYK